MTFFNDESQKDNSTETGGSSYTTPGGGYGYIYSPEPEPQKGSGKRTFLIISVILMVGLLAGCVILGSMLVKNQASRKLPDETDTTAPSSESDDERATSGMFIVIDPYATDTEEAATTAEDPIETIPGLERTGTETGTGVSEETSKTPIHTDYPGQVTINKKTGQSTDQDGDGRADIRLDANGLVITSAGDRALPIPTVVYRVADSVVEITTETIVRSSRMGQYVTSGAGSGVIISAEGLIVTNNHVIEAADSIKVRLTDGTEYDAVLLGTDEQSDVALLWIDAGSRKLTVATLGASSDLVVGEDIIAIGNPLGSLGGTVTEGIISATARNILIDGNSMVLLQVSSPINPGNSGGGLFNLAGELIGVVNAKMSETDVEGLGFAIPIDTAYKIISELYRYGYVRGRPTTGLTMADVTSSMTAMYYFSSPYTGVYITATGASDEFRSGDLILSVDGTDVSSVSEVNRIVNGKNVGDTIEVIVLRGTKNKVTIKLTLTEYIPEKKTQQPAV